ncbi:MAG: HPF/RaiA family ribosome-associated protein [Planctomycetia bacterium]|nr:HPF/RaiA family ribosome-associated protein [Planctomycetia bacterium]
MRIEVTKRNVTLAEGMRDWVERRLQFAVGRFSTQIRTVSVVFSDANGHRGRGDKHCRLRIMLNPSGEVVVEDTDPSVVEVVSIVAERAARSVNRELERRREGRSGS